MKVTRSYWLGLGSGFILSAILMGFISLYQGQAAMLAKPSVNSTVKQNKNSKLPQKTQSESSNPTQNSAQNFSAKSTSNSLNSATSDQNFVVPKGASAEQIADLLMAQGLIKDKVSFLKDVHQSGLDNLLKAGTFTLPKGLTDKELITRLVKK